MKERITITISDSLLKTIDKQVDGTNVKNRSHAIELAISKSLNKKELNQALILAGGSYEIEQEGIKIPTFMAKVNNKTIIEHNITNLKRQGITEIFINVSHRKDELMKLLGNGTNLGVEINYIQDDEPLGTAGSIKKAAEYIRGPFLVCNGDVLIRIDIPQFFKFHKKQGTTATVALTTTNSPQDFGVVVLNGTRIHSFIEKPQSKIPSNLINAGMYIFEQEIFEEFPEGYGKLETDVFPKLAMKEDFAGYVFYGKWNSVRTNELLAKAIKDW